MGCRLNQTDIPYLIHRSQDIDTTMTILASACQPNSTALDGVPGENGLYTGALLQALSGGTQLSCVQVGSGS